MKNLSDYTALSNDELHERIDAVKQELGSELLILGHHYQADDVIRHADLRGDSFKLSALAAENTECRAIVFCGVHFMAETADILANRPEAIAARGDQRRVNVILPELTAGCPMADMADRDQVEDCWRQLGEVIDTDDVMPVTYVNSSATLKAFCGRHGGIVCTSSNARSVLEWAFSERRRVLFFPDQHLGRNTSLAMGIDEKQMPLWDLSKPLGGNTPEQIELSKVILWNGYCCVHQRFTAAHIAGMREKHPGIRVIVHPECPREIVDLADVSGSTGQIIQEVKQSPSGSRWAIGTEWNLVNRLANECTDREIYDLGDEPSLCGMMRRVDLPHLCWSVESLTSGEPVNVIHVEEQTAREAEIALMRMLEHA